MIEFMKKTRDIYYKERNKLSFGFSMYNWLKKPMWMNISKDNRFEATYRDQRVLMRKGRIVIGKIVQANTLLFKPGPHSCPAAMVFSEDEYFEENPDKFMDIASRLYGIKGLSSNDEELQKFADILADEMVTLFNVKVPEKITFGKSVYFTTFMVHREHLPNGYIDFGCFPALICPEKTEASIILPSRYWATESNKIKKAIKILSNKELMELLDNDPERYTEVIQEHIEHALVKSRTSWLNKDKWSRRISYYRFQMTTALIKCGRMEESKELLEELLSLIHAAKAQENGNNFYVLVLSNLVSTLIDLEIFGKAKENIVLIEKTIANCKDKTKIEPFNKLLQWKHMELDILNGDLERGGRYLKSLLESDNNKTSLANIYMYFGIYHYKRSEKDKALDFFNKASDIIKDPYALEKIQYYKRMLMYRDPVYNGNPNEEVQDQIT